MPKPSENLAEKVIRDPMVVLENASKTYAVTQAKSKDAGASAEENAGGRKTRYVHSLRPTSFISVRGESVGVIGRNGSGKSTLLKLIAGSEPPTRGRVLVRSQPMLLGVSPVLQPYLSGRENVVLGCLALGMSREEALETEPSISEWADIGDAIDRPLRTYSAGQGARLGFAISTAMKPEILLVDEALSTGDAAFADRARERMSSLLEEAGNLFLVSHTPDQILNNCSRTLWIHRGEIISDGPSDRVVGEYQEWTARTKRGEQAGFIEKIRSDYTKPTIVFDPELG